MSKRYWIVAILLAVLAMLFMNIYGCKKASSPKEIDPVKKNPNACRVLKTFKSKNVRTDININCFEKGTGFYHLSALFPQDRAKEGGTETGAFASKHFGFVDIKQILVRKVNNEGRIYYFVVYRVIEPQKKPRL